MRVSARGFTLPWQLVAAQPPGPTYFEGSIVVAVAAGRAAALEESPNIGTAIGSAETAAASKINRSVSGRVASGRVFILSARRLLIQSVSGEVNAAFAGNCGLRYLFRDLEINPDSPIDPRREVCYTVLLWPSTARRARSAALIFEELKAIQREHGYISAEELAALAGRIDVPISRLHGVASF
jgi:hypothetical protein